MTKQILKSKILLVAVVFLSAFMANFLVSLSNVFAQEDQSGDAVVINIPQSDGGFTPVRLIKQGNGYIGPQGEYYEGSPTVQQLEVLYGGSPSTQKPLNSEPRVRYFYEPLRSYGEWIWHGTYGWVWRPDNVSVDWRPYTQGHWVLTDFGWTWVSDHPWGWACFHYGRWFYDDFHGWLWYPDTVWAPCWVVWRTGGDWIGWAPLPPRARWHATIGLTFIDSDAVKFVSWHAYSFCRIHEFSDPELTHRIVLPARNVTIIKTTNVTPITIKIVNNRVVNQLPFGEKIIKSAPQPIRRFKITETDSPEHRGVVGNELRIFRPQLAQTKSHIPAKVLPKTQLQSSEQSVLSQQETTPKQTKAINSYESDMRSLQQLHSDRQRLLEQEHVKEMNNPPVNMTRQQLIEQHMAEVKANQELMAREHKLLQNKHKGENTSYSVPGTQSQQPPNVPAQHEKNNDIESRK